MYLKFPRTRTHPNPGLVRDNPRARVQDLGEKIKTYMKAQQHQCVRLQPLCI